MNKYNLPRNPYTMPTPAEYNKMYRNWYGPNPVYSEATITSRKHGWIYSFVAFVVWFLLFILIGAIIALFLGLGANTKSRDSHDYGQSGMDFHWKRYLWHRNNN